MGSFDQVCLSFFLVYSPKSQKAFEKNKQTKNPSAFWSNTLGSKSCDVIYGPCFPSVFDYKMVPQPLLMVRAKGEHTQLITFIKYENSEFQRTLDSTVSE